MCKVRSGRRQPIVDVPVQRGRELPRPELPDGIEILSGLNPGDRLVHAVKLGSIRRG